MKSGNFERVHLEMIAQAHAVEAIPALKEQFAVNQDVLTKAQIASALVRLGDQDSRYWDFLVTTATEALDSDPPGFVKYDSEGKAVSGPPPELESWARDHHLTLQEAGDELMFKVPAAVNMLAVTGDRRGIPVLRRALSSRNPLVQLSGARGLALINDSDSASLIVEVCSKAPPETAAMIARSLVYFDDVDAQSAFDKYVPKEAARELRKARSSGKNPFQ